MRNYSQDHVDASRRRVDSQVSAYQALAAAGAGPVEHDPTDPVTASGWSISRNHDDLSEHWP